jgi:Flp pilus assembly protein TadG
MKLPFALFSRKSDDRTVGQALVELALILPVLLILVLGAVDLGRVFYSQITVTNAAREGALEAARNPDSYDAGQGCDVDDNRVMCRAINEAGGSFVTVLPADVTMSCTPSCTPGTPASPHTVAVSVQGHFSLLTPLMAVFTGGTNMTLSATASATIVMTPTLGSPVVPTPTPMPTATPTPTPGPTGTAGPTSTPTPVPTPTPTPPCVAPTSSFTVSPATGVKNKTLFQFTSTATNMDNISCNPIWSWNFGGAGTSGGTAQNPTFKFSSRGTYTVTLTVSNTAGNSTSSRDINVTNN